MATIEGDGEEGRLGGLPRSKAVVSLLPRVVGPGKDGVSRETPFLEVLFQVTDPDMLERD